jgi:apolipoprotein N-acyltransferase
MDNLKNHTSKKTGSSDFMLHGIGWVLLSCLSAVFLFLSFPNPGISAFAWPALVPFLLILMRGSFKKTILAALITATLFNTVYIIWMKEYKHPATLTGGVFTEIVFFMGAVIVSWFIYHNFPRKGKISRPLRLIATVFGWLMIDYVKTIGFLAFPWGILSYSQYRNLALIQSATIFGIWGIDFLILYINVSIASVLIEFIYRKNPLHREQRGRIFRSFIHLFVGTGLIIASLLFGFYELKDEKRVTHDTKRVALVQANFDPWSPRLKENISNEIELTQRALGENPDIVIWSESSVPFPYEFYLQRKNAHAQRVHNFITSVNKPFIFGTLEFEGNFVNGEYEGDFYNVAVYYNEGKISGVYRKIHLVPFGEWFPYKRLFPFVVKILREAGAGDFAPGTDFSVFENKDIAFNVLICFEDVFGNLTRKFILKGSQLIINITNDAWTGSEKAEVQHYSKSVFRTIESRRSLVRAANGGVTVGVNPYGRPLKKLELFTSNYLVVDVPILGSERITFYTKYGDIVPIFITCMVLLGCAYLLTKKIIDRTVNRNKM